MSNEELMVYRTLLGNEFIELEKKIEELAPYKFDKLKMIKLKVLSIQSIAIEKELKETQSKDPNKPHFV